MLSWINKHSKILSIAVGVLGLVWGVYQHLAAKQEREITFTVHPIRTVIASGNRPEDIQVSFKGKSLNQDITETRVFLWNAGRKSVRTENILDQVTIVPDRKVEILKVEPIHVTRPNVIKFRVTETREANNSFAITWTILEQNDGVILRIYHTGGPEVMFEATGSIEEQGSIKNAPSKRFRTEKDQYLENQRQGKLLVTGGIFLTSLSFLILLYYSTRLWFVRRRLTKMKNDSSLISQREHLVGRLANSLANFTIFLILTLVTAAVYFHETSSRPDWFL